MATKQENVSKQEIKDLIDGLPDSELHAAKRYLQYLRDYNDPFLNALAKAPWDDEPLTEDDLKAIAESKEDIAAGRVVSQEELKKELGI